MFGTVQARRGLRNCETELKNLAPLARSAFEQIKYDETNSSITSSTRTNGSLPTVSDNHFHLKLS